MFKFIKRLITKFKVWNDIRKYKKLLKKCGAVRYMDTSSMYPNVLKVGIFPLNGDFIYADTDSVLVNQQKGETK